jgi:tRNA (guanine37-N1)-methyltransferase
MSVPDVLVSGNHAKISKWRRREAVRKTARNRPDLLKEACLSESEEEISREPDRGE